MPAVLTPQALALWQRWRDGSEWERRDLAETLHPNEVAGLARLEQNLSAHPDRKEWWNLPGTGLSTVRGRKGLLPDLMAGLTLHEGSSRKRVIGLLLGALGVWDGHHARWMETAIEEHFWPKDAEDENMASLAEKLAERLGPEGIFEIVSDEQKRSLAREWGTTPATISVALSKARKAVRRSQSNGAHPPEESAEKSSAAAELAGDSEKSPCPGCGAPMFPGSKQCRACYQKAAAPWESSATRVAEETTAEPAAAPEPDHAALLADLQQRFEVLRIDAGKVADHCQELQGRADGFERERDAARAELEALQREHHALLESREELFALLVTPPDGWLDCETCTWADLEPAKRIQMLYGHVVISRRTLEVTRAQNGHLRADLESAEAQRDAARAELAETQEALAKALREAVPSAVVPVRPQPEPWEPVRLSSDPDGWRSDGSRLVLNPEQLREALEWALPEKGVSLEQHLAMLTHAADLVILSLSRQVIPG